MDLLFTFEIKFSYLIQVTLLLKLPHKMSKSQEIFIVSHRNTAHNLVTFQWLGKYTIWPKACGPQ